VGFVAYFARDQLKRYIALEESRARLDDITGWYIHTYPSLETKFYVRLLRLFIPNDVCVPYEELSTSIKRSRYFKEAEDFEIRFELIMRAIFVVNLFWILLAHFMRVRVIRRILGELRENE
jgi:hypothetical protein